MTDNRLILTEADLRQVAGITDTALAAVESAFTALQHGRVNMPPVMHIEVAEHNGDVDVKSAYIEGLPRFAVKLGSEFRDNPARGLPMGSAMMVVLNSQSGFCEAVLLDNGYLTDLRTGLAGALAAKYLAPQEVETVGVLGTGVQARFQVRCLQLVRKFRRIVVWGRSADKREAYVREMGAMPGIEVIAADSPENVVRACELLITSTASDRPLVEAAWLKRGQHITAVGSDFPGKQELDAEVLRRADRLVCDRIAQCVRLGELQHLTTNGELPRDIEVVELGALTTGDAEGRRNAGEITVCDLTGTGIQDTAIAHVAVAAALEAGLGSRL